MHTLRLEIYERTNESFWKCQRSTSNFWIFHKVDTVRIHSVLNLVDTPNYDKFRCRCSAFVQSLFVKTCSFRTVDVSRNFSFLRVFYDFEYSSLYYSILVAWKHATGKLLEPAAIWILP